MRYPLSLRSVVLAVAVCATPSLATSQGPGLNTRLASPQAAAAFDVSTGTIQDLTLPAGGGTFTVRVQLGNKIEQLELELVDVRTADFRFLIADDQGIHVAPTPAPVTYRGMVAGVADSAVAATLVDGRLQATVTLNGTTWGIQAMNEVDPSRPAAEHIVYAASNTIVTGVNCGVPTVHAPDPGPQIGIDVIQVAEIACEGDFPYFTANGSNATTAQNAITAVINGMNVIYQRDVEITHVITTILIRTSSGSDPYSSTIAGTLLGQFQNWWNANQGGVQRDMAHLFTGRSMNGGTIGVAYLGVVCNIGSAYGLSERFTTNMTSLIGLTSHECGHNWNSNHCDGNSPCWIMCSGLGGCSGNITQFEPYGINAITQFRNSRGCLYPQSPPPTLTSAVPNNAQVFAVPGELITLNGTNLDVVTTLNVGPIPVPPRTRSTNQITYHSPIGDRIGVTVVTATSQAGTSNPVLFVFNQTDPALSTAPVNALRNTFLDLDVAGDPLDNYWFIASFNDATTVPFQGFDVLLNFLVLGNGSLNIAGYSRFPLRVPNVPMTNITMRSQAVLLAEGQPVLQAITGISSTFFWF